MPEPPSPCRILAAVAEQQDGAYRQVGGVGGQLFQAVADMRGRFNWRDLLAAPSTR